MPTAAADLARCQVTAGRDSHQAQRIEPRMWIESERDSGHFGSRERTLVPVRPTPHSDAARSAARDCGDRATSEVHPEGSVATVRLDGRLRITTRGSVPCVASHAQVFQAQTSEPHLKLREGR